MFVFISELYMEQLDLAEDGPVVGQDEHLISSMLIENLESNPDKLGEEIIFLYKELSDLSNRNYAISFEEQYGNRILALYRCFQSIDAEQKRKLFGIISPQLKKYIKLAIGKIVVANNELLNEINGGSFPNYFKFLDSLIAAYTMQEFVKNRSLKFTINEDILGFFDNLNLIEKDKIDMLLCKASLHFVIKILILIQKNPMLVQSRDSLMQAIHIIGLKIISNGIFRKHFEKFLLGLGFSDSDIEELIDIFTFFGEKNNLVDTINIMTQMDLIRTIMSRNNININSINIKEFDVKEYTHFLTNEV